LELLKSDPGKENEDEALDRALKSAVSNLGRETGATVVEI
jgi:hypothetical protein